MAARRGSHRPVRVTCDFERSGRTDPNARHRSLDDRFFADVDTEAKAYLLGWIASDGAITRTSIALYLHRKDTSALRQLRDIVCPELPLRRKRPSLLGFVVDSIGIVTDVCRHLAIGPGTKDAVVQFPALADERLAWTFLRGFFDGAGSISRVDAARRRSARGAAPRPRCRLATTSSGLLDAVQRFCGIPAHRGAGVLEWDGTNALDFLGRLYDGATYYLPRKRDLYLDWCYWVPALSGPGNRGEPPIFFWNKVLPDAVAPSRAHASDSGFDLTLIARAHRHGMVEFFRTGVRVQPAFGWYFDVVPRSSIAKTGYILANSVGVIDRGYVGEILVPLIKIDPSAPELALPARVVQMIPRPIVSVQLGEVADLDETKRGDGGFGSTGR